jgi:hypothetical protein
MEKGGKDAKIRNGLRKGRKVVSPVVSDGSCLSLNIIQENSKRRHERFGRHGDVVPEICAGLNVILTTYYYIT